MARAQSEEPARIRTSHGPLLPGLAVVLALLAYVVLSNPGSASYWAREAYRRATGGTQASYAFMATRTVTSEPVAWDRCRPIHYQVNPEHAPPGWQRLVEQAFADLAEGSVYEFVDDGTTSDRDFLDRRPSAPVLLGWGGPAEFDELDGDVAGFGGATSLRVGDRRRYLTGTVLLDSGDYAQMSATGRRAAMRLILEHELLHVLGLDHVEDRDQLMYATYRGQGGLGAGDLAGLRQLGAQPCA